MTARESKKGPESPLDVFRKFGALVPKGRRGRWVVLGLMSAVAAALEAIGGLLIYGLLELVQGGEGGIGGMLEDAVGALFPSASESATTMIMLIAAAVFFVVRSVLLVGLTYYQSRIAQSEGVRISSTLVGGYLSAEYEFHLSADPSILIRNVTSSVDDATIRFLVPISRIFSESLSVVALVTVLLVSAPGVTLIAAGAIGATAWIVMRIIRPKFHAIGRLNQDLTSRLLAVLSESFEGIRDVVVTGSTWRYMQDFTRARADQAGARVRRFTYDALPRYALEALLIVGVLVFLSLEVARDATEESIALIGLFAYTALRTLPAVNRVTQAVNKIRYSTAAVDDVLEDLENVPKVDLTPPAPVTPLSFKDSFEVQGVDFKYATSDRLILDDVSLQIRPGESIGIAGPTGSGKSTLVDVLLGLLPPTRGRVTVDGENLEEVVDRWHRTLGVVSQRVFLANATLARNVALTEAGEDIDMERVRECVSVAQLDGLLEELPDGLETVIGGTGTRFSGGEGQRVAIARALYRDPDVLFLDEATSAIDGATEAALVAALRASRPDRTLVMVAHRLNTLQDCDRVLLMDEGRVVAAGPYQELLDSNELFSRIARSKTDS